jgi:GDP-4-dehydro-6-deoxy-D-mannose reductase
VRVLLTGIAGFAGSYLADLLVQEPDIEVHGVVHRSDRRIAHLAGQLHLHRGDLRNALWISEVIEAVRPEYALHLAAWSDVGGSWQQPWTTYELNIQCQLNLLEALRRWQPACRTLIVSSNEIYGLVDAADLPIDEATPFRPNSPYGVSKLTQDMMALQYFNSHRLPTIRARSFNHLGPGQADEFAASAFARQIAEIELGLREPVVRVGNLSAERDFTDVRDVVRAYWLLAQHGEAGLCYNIGSGAPRAIRDLLDTLLELSPASIRVELDPARLRPSDVPRTYCDNRRLVQATGWQPVIDLRTTLHDLLEGWRAQLR